jgi:hypothetical protein
MGFDEEAACGGFEFHAEDFGSLVMPEGQSKEEAEQISHAIQSIFGAFSSCAIFGSVTESLLK